MRFSIETLILLYVATLPVVNGLPFRPAPTTTLNDDIVVPVAHAARSYYNTTIRNTTTPVVPPYGNHTHIHNCTCTCTRILDSDRVVLNNTNKVPNVNDAYGPNAAPGLSTNTKGWIAVGVIIGVVLFVYGIIGCFGDKWKAKWCGYRH
ncbi:hypothetical protein B0T14DRAFT_494187 [Immersiella caudata]|uniref:Transmembrane protein n=1 Tax=Immersiella caudata TaxID=314043 RepID=A0AA40C2G6_9PEZI|nr:hypothetical protein B0T14DRAFT_494187 [Immersiella caudata]